jgi:hypothetical protein
MDSLYCLSGWTESRHAVSEKKDRQLIEDLVAPVYCRGHPRVGVFFMKNRNECLCGIYLQEIKMEDGNIYFVAL